MLSAKKPQNKRRFFAAPKSAPPMARISDETATVGRRTLSIETPLDAFPDVKKVIPTQFKYAGPVGINPAYLGMVSKSLPGDPRAIVSVKATFGDALSPMRFDGSVHGVDAFVVLMPVMI